MYLTLDCIALRTVRYNDKHSILSAYSRQRGRLSLLISAGAGREATRRRAMIMPGSRFSCVADIRDIPGKIPAIRDVRSRGHSPGSVADPVKSAVTLFIVDFLNTIMRDAQPDELLFDFVDGMLDCYATLTGPGQANFHLLFLIRLMHFLGIEPDLSTYHDGYVFDMDDAVFRSSPPLHGRFLEPTDSRTAARLLRINLRNMSRYRFSATDRNQILGQLINYYTIHFASLRSMKSLDVLRALFH